LFGLPPFRYLRKTALVFVFLFLCFLGHQIFVSLHDSEESEQLNMTPEKIVYSVVCRNIVSGAPFGVDSTFPERSRLHYYSLIPKSLVVSKEEPLRHIWYLGVDTLQNMPCVVSDSICFSSISPELLHRGEWSVDLVQGRKLLASRQFKVEAAGL